MFKKTKKNVSFFDLKMSEQKRLHDELLKKELNNLNEKINSDKYAVDTMISKSKLGYVYHDLIDSKDKLNSDYQRKYNQTYHSIDIKLNKINKRIDNESKKIDYVYNNKKEKVLNNLLTRIVG